MTGKTVEEAVEAALDRLGVAETDAEVVVVEEPKSGMFGLRRSSARIRARVRPVQPRAKRPSRRATGAGEAASAGAVADSQVDLSGSEGRGASSADGRSRKRVWDGSEQTAVSSVSRRDPVRMAPRSPGPGCSCGRRRGRGGGNPEMVVADRQVAQRSRPAVGAAGTGVDKSDGVADKASSGPGRVTGSPKEGPMSIETQQELAGGFVKEVVARFGIERDDEGAPDRGRRHPHQRRG